MNIVDIRSILPHRFPFLFIDKVVRVDLEKERIVCLKNMTFNESFFQGHFPDNPITPGVIIIESMAQAGVLLFFALKPDIASLNPDYFLGSVKMRFLKPVVPGDQLLLDVSALKITDSGGAVEAFAKVGDCIVAKGQLTFGVKSKKSDKI